MTLPTDSSFGGFEFRCEMFVFCSGEVLCCLVEISVVLETSDDCIRGLSGGCRKINGSYVIRNITVPYVT